MAQSQRRRRRTLGLLALSALKRAALLTAAGVMPVAAASAQQPPSPSAALKMEVGADRTLADWSQITSYFQTLARSSSSLRVDTLGPSTDGKPFIVATISTPENLRRLEQIRATQARLADPRGLSADEERRLIASQPAVVLISCNIHATEIGSSQMAMELAHRLITNDTLRGFLSNTIVLLVPSMNPDGQQLVTDWYRKELGTKWEGGAMPWLYHPYVGHDNNRDWYMVTQIETRHVTDLLYRRWFPEVFYDVHQQGNLGMRISMPPHVDPIDENVDPLIVRGINLLGAEMSAALEAQGKTGVGDGVTYDLWWHGGARSTPTRHNMVGLLTEAASVNIATPITQKLTDLKGHPRGLPKYERRVNFPNPWPGGTWRLRDIMDYERIAAEALIKHVSLYREDYVRNFVTLGRKAVRLGSTEGPYAYVIPADQRDPTAVQRLIEVLRVGAVEVGKADEAFSAGGQQFAAGSYVVNMAQPYRAHAKDLLEEQRFPKMEQWPGGPPAPPYDVAGWTLPYQLGVKAIAIAMPLSVRTTAISGMRDESACSSALPAKGFAVLDARDTRSYSVLARALAKGNRAHVATVAVSTSTGTAPAGSFVLEKPLAVGDVAGTCGSAIATARALPAGRVMSRMPRLALYKSWTASMDEGWTRWVLEQHAMPYTSVSDSTIRAGGLRAKFDALMIPDMTLRQIRSGMTVEQVPPQYAGGLGAEGVAALKRFAEEGGTLILLDHASELATAELGIPVTRITTSTLDDEGETAGGRVRNATPQSEQLYAPGSILRTLTDRSQPTTAGLPDTVGVYFTNSTTFDVPSGSSARVLLRYPSRADDILMSGYLQGGGAIAGKAAAVEAPLGKGKVVLFGFRPQYRGQSVGTFKMLFRAVME